MKERLCFLTSRIFRENLTTSGAAFKKFKKLKDYPCALVLYNDDKLLVSLRPTFVFGAMLGNLGFRIPVDLGRGIPAGVKAHSVFTTGGKMIRYGPTQRPMEPQNRSISAVMALGKLLVGQKACMKWLSEAEETLGRRMTFEESLEVIESWSGTEKDVSRSELRIIVFENPYARIPWPKNLFAGAWDERYGLVDGGFIRRLYAGQALRDWERLTGEVPDFPDV